MSERELPAGVTDEDLRPFAVDLAVANIPASAPKHIEDAFIESAMMRFRAVAHLVAERVRGEVDAALVDWALTAGWATGHGDTLLDLIAEMRLCWVEERARQHLVAERVVSRYDAALAKCCIPGKSTDWVLCFDHAELQAELEQLRAALGERGEERDRG